MKKTSPVSYCQGAVQTGFYLVEGFVFLHIDKTMLLALQVLCSQKDKVIVKDYNYLRQGTMKTKAETLQFDVDYVLDDSFLPRGNRQRKEESQKRMFETFGLPCIEYALDGYNTTVNA